MGAPVLEQVIEGVDEVILPRPPGRQYFAQAGRDVRETVKLLIQALREQFGFSRESIERMKPYVVRFVEEARDGTISLTERTRAMYQIAAAVWNRVAREQPLATAWAKKMFPLEAENLNQALEKEEKRIAAEVGGSLQIAAVYLQVMPLLWERRALAAYNRNHQTLLFPDVATVNEAVEMAARDCPMNPRQKASLRRLLKTRPE